MMGKMMWMWRLLEAQGYSMGPSMILQDNQGAMLLEKNGTWSSSKRTRHLDISYYYRQQLLILHKLVHIFGL